MTLDLDTAYVQWNVATANLPWGVQRAFHDALSAAADGDVRLVYNRDYGDGSACLVNSVGSLLKVGGGHGVPMREFGIVVSMFDEINRLLRDVNVNVENDIVSPLAADILLTQFAPLKPVPTGEPGSVVNLQTVENPYIEMNDVEFQEAISNMFKHPTKTEIEFLNGAVTFTNDHYHDLFSVGPHWTDDKSV